MHTYIHSFIPSFLPFIHSFTHSFIHSIIHTYIYIYNIQMQEKHKVSCERFGFYRMVHAIDEIRHGNVEYCNACHGKFGNISFAHETYAASTQTPKCVFQFSRWEKKSEPICVGLLSQGRQQTKTCKCLCICIPK